jgi:hypothetical protein
VGTIEVAAERQVGAPAPVVYGWLADYADHHHRFLPGAFSDYAVESGGVGAGTVVAFSVTAGGRTRAYHVTDSEPEPGRVLQESDSGSSLVTTFTVTPGGDTSTVCIASNWTGAGGIGGFFEKRFAPKVLRKLYLEELDRIDAYARNRGA